MRRSVLLVFSIVIAGIGTATAQTGSRFPGINDQHLTELRSVKRSLAFPLPTWIPDGFKLERINKKLGRRVSLDEKEFVVVYARTRGSETQRFAIEAGFEGLGDLPYEETHTVRSGVGTIYLAYQPRDDDGKNLTDVIMTHWFNVGRTAYHFDGAYRYQEDGPAAAGLSLSDTLKILRSLRRF